MYVYFRREKERERKREREQETQIFDILVNETLEISTII